MKGVAACLGCGKEHPRKAKKVAHLPDGVWLSALVSRKAKLETVLPLMRGGLLG